MLWLQEYVFPGAALSCWSYVTFHHRWTWRSTWILIDVSIHLDCCPGRPFVLSGYREELLHWTVQRTSCSALLRHVVLSTWQTPVMHVNKITGNMLPSMALYSLYCADVLEPCTGRAGLYSFEKTIGPGWVISGPGQHTNVQRFCGPNPSPSCRSWQHQPFQLPCRCKLSITPPPDLTLASPVGELIIFNMQIAELCFGLCQQ